MKATYLIVDKGVVKVMDKVKPDIGKREDWMYAEDYDLAYERNKKELAQFIAEAIELAYNPDIQESYLSFKVEFFWEGNRKLLLIPKDTTTNKAKDGIYPAPEGLMFEVKDEPNVGNIQYPKDDIFKQVAICSFVSEPEQKELSPDFWKEAAKMLKDCGTYKEHYSKDEQSAMYDMAETIWRLYVLPAREGQRLAVEGGNSLAKKYRALQEEVKELRRQLSYYAGKNQNQ